MMTDSNNALGHRAFSELLDGRSGDPPQAEPGSAQGNGAVAFFGAEPPGAGHAEKTPAQLATTFRCDPGAMSNTLSKLEWAGLCAYPARLGRRAAQDGGDQPAGRPRAMQAISAIAPLVARRWGRWADRGARALPILRLALQMAGEA
jgi:hypothetical protein